MDQETQLRLTKIEAKAAKFRLMWFPEKLYRWWTSDRPKETLMEVTDDGVHHVEID